MIDLGRGIVFPIQLNARGGVDIVSDLELVKSSMRIILTWALGTKFFQGEFGSNIHRALGEPNDFLQARLVAAYAETALIRNETRIDLMEVQTRIDNGKLSLAIVFRLKGSVTESTYIYPYYKEITT